ncbi:MAG: ATP-binding cassette domain-containing protein [candidate division KSB1 bacterium]|nr:ATP-binding cassette domain-containing protein [candidate division KSB1 bacterium]MDZ7318521.1 ATP-binding cassette domain-containing protein [candidate division KSB1 bacterium]MDZ7342174.1 ATP-binding cassette domain-containing protein [candidate division KSB1 bacterium]
MIEVRDICYEYPSAGQASVRALDHVSLQIHEGEYVAIMGRNSSGKTTLARSLNALLRPQSGSILIDQLSTADEQHIIPIRKKVGMVFQNPDNQIVATTVEREIAFGLENLSVPPIEMQRIVEVMLERFNLKDYRKYPPSMLSGGEKQRLALAAVMAMKPKYLILDEPTSMLDPQSRRDLLDLLKGLKDENCNKCAADQMTIILITQFPEEALEADRLLILHQGRILFDDAPAKVFQHVEQLQALGLEVPVEFEILPLLVAKGYAADILQGFYETIQAE